jgi:hypothetical protein
MQNNMKTKYDNMAIWQYHDVNMQNTFIPHFHMQNILINMQDM